MEPLSHHASSAFSNLNNNPSAVLDWDMERLTQKIAKSSLNFENLTVNWSRSRAVTAYGTCGYKDATGLKFFSFDDQNKGQLFYKGEESHGLFSKNEQVIAASVTKTIQNLNRRKEEKKSTFIQYDKMYLKEKENDFDVDMINYQGFSTYEGGHLIDYKLSDGISHSLEGNYIPVHYFYNHPLKEYLVNRCEAYIEIPIYTANPPEIKIKGQDKYHRIPVGILFIQINQNKIQDIYYFPNNNFNYEALKERLEIKKQIAATLVPYFKLKPTLYPLFRSAMIYDVKLIKEGLPKQVKQESKCYTLMDEIALGVLMPPEKRECCFKEIKRFCFHVLNEDYVDSFFYFAYSEDELFFQGQPLGIPLDELGKFIIQYVIRNVLKSEVYSTKARLTFLNMMIDCIDNFFDLDKNSFKFIDSFANEVLSTLDDLEKIVPTMTLDEMFSLTNAYYRLTSEFNLDIANEGYNVYEFSDYYNYCDKFIKIFQILSLNKVENFNFDQECQFLFFILRAQEAIYFLADFCEEEEYKEQINFLKNMRSPSLKLLDKLKTEKESSRMNLKFQTDSNRTRHISINKDYFQSVLENLGE